jgi:Ulp1 family protease
LELNIFEGVSFLGGFEADEPKTSEFFKLQKICTLKKNYQENIKLIYTNKKTAFAASFLSPKMKRYRPTK